MLLAGPLLACSGSLLAERDSLTLVIFAAITSGILLHAAQTQSSQSRTARCCKREERAFPLYQEHCHQLTPPRQPAVLLQLQTFLNILMEKHARVGFYFFYYFYFFPLSNCTAARSFKASRSGAAFLCLIENMCVCLEWRRRVWRGAGLPEWSCRGRSLWHGDGGTDPAMLTWATEPVG